LYALIRLTKKCTSRSTGVKQRFADEVGQLKVTLSIRQMSAADNINLLKADVVALNFVDTNLTSEVDALKLTDADLKSEVVALKLIDADLKSDVEALLPVTITLGIYTILYDIRDSFRDLFRLRSTRLLL
jgi:hypothetical protein